MRRSRSHRNRRYRSAESGPTPNYSEYREHLGNAQLPLYDHSKTLLLIIDMQYDFIDEEHGNDENKYGNNFGVVDSKEMIPDMVSFIKQHQGDVALTRDYHPCNHVSFNRKLDNNEVNKLCGDCAQDCPEGPFPSHCLHGSRGAMIHEEIKNACNKGKTHVFFKGFHKHIDSFGGAPYNTETWKDFRNPKAYRVKWNAGCHFITGSYKIKCIQDPFAQDPIGFPYENDCDKCTLPPNKFESLEAFIQTMQYTQVIVCGLALDYCVIDTARNLAFKLNNVDILIHTGLCRPAFVPAQNGYLTDATKMKEEVDRVNQLSSSEIQFVRQDLTATNRMLTPPGFRDAEILPETP